MVKLYVSYYGETIYLVLSNLSDFCGFQKYIVRNNYSTYIWIFAPLSGSSHIGTVLICVKYRNCCQTLDFSLLFVILLGQIKSKLNSPSQELEGMETWLHIRD